MRLLAGPPGSGKTSAVLDAVRQAIRSGRPDIRLLVPTATMAEHLENQLAREGLLLRRRTIQTLSGFVTDVTPDLRQAGDTVLYLLVEQAARRIRRPEFERVAGMPGFHAAAARVIEEFSSAGCDSARLAACLPDAPLADAFLEIYRATERELERRGLVLRARRIQLAAARIEAQGTGGIGAIWMDGFHALPDPELRLMAALARHAELTLTSEEENTGAGYFGPVTVEHAGRPRPAPAIAVVRAPSIERECDEIARRILEQSSAGRPFREMGIIVRAAGTYVPILRATLERFGIPARFYFEPGLDRQPAVRLPAAAVEALLGGWDHQAVLAVLRLAPRLAVSGALDRLDFAARERTPDAGLAALAALTDAPPLRRMLEDLGAIEEWRGVALEPREWAARVGGLRRLFRPSLHDQPGHEGALEYRSQALSLDAFEAALAQAADAMEGGPIRLADFWRTAQSALRLEPLRVPDGRRNVVRVLSAPEARQWVLPVVFVCGLVEKQFPQFHHQDPFFPDAARTRLNAAGVRVRTAAQFEREERALFRSAVTRATILTTLTYPEFDARGERNLPSLFLESLALSVEAARPVRPWGRPPGLPSAPSAPPTNAQSAPPAGAEPRKPTSIASPPLLEFLAARTRTLSPTALETYLACPFQYFATRLLRLKTAPPLPAERLDFLTQGNIVHEVLAGWWREGGDIAARFESVFARYVEDQRILAASYQTERLRNGMLEDLLQFARSDTWPRAAYQSRTEEPFEFELAPGLSIRGKIDRLDVLQSGAGGSACQPSPATPYDRVASSLNRTDPPEAACRATPPSAFVIDYKYSAPERVKERREDPNLLQAPLYLMAAEKYFHLRPAGMFYAGVKSQIRYVGWGDGAPVEGEPIPEDWFPRTTARTLGAVGEIRGGRVEPAPANPAKCRYCDARDICRFETGQAEAPAARAEGV